MSTYRVEVAYITKRGGVSIGCYVEATNEESAMELAEEKFVTPYKARRFAAASARKLLKGEKPIGGVINP